MKTYLSCLYCGSRELEADASPAGTEYRCQKCGVIMDEMEARTVVADDEEQDEDPREE